MILAVAHSLNITYLWSGVIIGVIALATVGVTVVKALRAMGAKEERDKALLDLVPKLNERLAAIEKAMKPNGLDTNQIGDMAARAELKLEQIDSKMDQHIGAEREARERIHDRLRRLERRAT